MLLAALIITTAQNMGFWQIIRIKIWVMLGKGGSEKCGIDRQTVTWEVYNEGLIWSWCCTAILTLFSQKQQCRSHKQNDMHIWIEPYFFSAWEKWTRHHVEECDHIESWYALVTNILTPPVHCGERQTCCYTRIYDQHMIMTTLILDIRGSWWYFLVTNIVARAGVTPSDATMCANTW